MKRFYGLLFILACTISFVDGVQAQVPPAPSNLTVEQGVLGGAVLHWDTMGREVGFKVYKSADNSEFHQIAVLPLNMFFDWATEVNHHYRYYIVAFNMMGIGGSSDTVEFNPAPPPPPVVHGFVKGVVLDDVTGLPLRESIVQFFKPTAELRFSTAYTDSNGEYCAALDTGSYFVRTMKFGYVPEWFDGVHRLVDATSVPVLQNDTSVANFSLQRVPPVVPVTISGLVTDSASGSPLPGAYVVVLRPFRGLRLLQSLTRLFCGFPFERIEIPGLGFLHGVVWISRTDSSGHYAAHVLSGSRYIALALKPGYVHKFFKDKFTPFDADRILMNQDTTGIDFALLPNPLAVNHLAGMVVDSSGTGIPSHVVLLRLTPWGPRPVRFRMTDSVGNYLFSNLVAGKFFVRAVPVNGFAPAWYNATECGARGWHNADTVEVNASVDGINVCVKPLTISGFARIAGVVNESGGSATTVKPSQGAVVYAISNTTNQVAGYDVTEDDGSFSMDNLLPGTYSIVVDKEGYTSGTNPSFALDAGNSYEVDGTSLELTPEAPLAVEDLRPIVPTRYNLKQNYPNPFNPVTEIGFEIPKLSSVSLKVFNLIGQELTMLAYGNYDPGEYSARWSGTDRNGESVVSGVYFVKLVAVSVDGTGPTFSQVRKIILLK